MERATRGRTAPGRLEALDAYLTQTHPELFVDAGPLRGTAFIDVGFGESGVTTLESAARFRTLNPALEVVGFERDPLRLAHATAGVQLPPGVTLRLGGFDEVARCRPQARLVRAMNVLRSYSFDEAAAAHGVLGEALVEGGLLVEGSADPKGTILTAHAIRRRRGTMIKEATLFFTRFEQGFAPLRFRDWLPRDLRRSVRPGEPIHAFLQRWTEAWEGVRREARLSPREAFLASAETLARQVRGVRVHPDMVGGAAIDWSGEP